MSTWRKVIIAIVLMLTLCLLFRALAAGKTIFVESTSASAQNTENPSAPLRAWLKQLRSGENCPDSGLIDSNGTSSYGSYCYQANTFIGFTKASKLLPQAEDREILNFIGDHAFQDRLTFWVYTHIPYVWTHWANTVNKIGLPPGISTSTHMVEL